MQLEEISTHTPLTGRDLNKRLYRGLNIISTHTPLTGRDRCMTAEEAKLKYFYSHAPYGTWPMRGNDVKYPMSFLLTRPLRDVTFLDWRFWFYLVFLLTRPLRDVTISEIEAYNNNCISTHTPLTGRDIISLRHYLKRVISTHTPLTGRDKMLRLLCRICLFLLTRPLRDVTNLSGSSDRWRWISTHTPLTGRDIDPIELPYSAYISTHTPLTGRDMLGFCCWMQCGISTHTPLTGRDRQFFWWTH